VLIFFKAGAFVPDGTIIEQTNAGYETKSLVGHPLGS